MKSSALQERLARSLDRANAREAAEGRAAAHVADPALHVTDRCAKISVSLYGADRRRVEEIRALVLARTGRSISTSACVRAALRAALLREELADAYEAASREGRRR